MEIRGPTGQTTQNGALELPDVGPTPGDQRSTRIRGPDRLPGIGRSGIRVLEGIDPEIGRVQDFFPRGIRNANVERRADRVVANTRRVVTSSACALKGLDAKRII